jgi:hypothetical protein
MTHICCCRYVSTTNSKIKAAGGSLETMDGGILDADAQNTDRYNWSLLIGQKGAGNESKIPAKELPILQEWMQSDVRQIWRGEKQLPETWQKQIEDVMQYEEGEDVMLTYSKHGSEQ